MFIAAGFQMRVHSGGVTSSFNEELFRFFGAVVLLLRRIQSRGFDISLRRSEALLHHTRNYKHLTPTE